MSFTWYTCEWMYICGVHENSGRIVGEIGGYVSKVDFEKVPLVIGLVHVEFVQLLCIYYIFIIDVQVLQVRSTRKIFCNFFFLSKNILYVSNTCVFFVISLPSKVCKNLCVLHFFSSLVLLFVPSNI